MGKIAKWRANAVATLKRRYYRVRNRTRMVFRSVVPRIRLAASGSAQNIFFRLGWSLAGVGGVVLGLEHFLADAPWLLRLGLGLVVVGLGLLTLVSLRYLILGEPEGRIIETIRLGGGWLSPTVYIKSAVDTPMMRVKLSRYVDAKTREIRTPSIPVEIPWSNGSMREPFAPGDVGFVKVGEWKLKYDEACIRVGVQRLIQPVCGIELRDGVYQSWMELEFTAQGVRAPQRVWFTFTVHLDDDGEIVQMSGSNWPRGVARRILKPRESAN